MQYICVTEAEHAELSRFAAAELVSRLRYGPGTYIFITPSGLTTSFSLTEEDINATA